MLTEKEAFKVGFLYKCADAGLTQEETIQAAKCAEAFLKQADVQDFLTKPYNVAWDIAANTGKSLGNIGVAGLLLGPGAIGAGLGAGAAAITDVDDTDVAAIKQQELIDEYNRQKALLNSRRRGAYKRPQSKA